MKIINIKKYRNELYTWVNNSLTDEQIDVFVSNEEKNGNMFSKYEYIWFWDFIEHGNVLKAFVNKFNRT